MTRPVKLTIGMDVGDTYSHLAVLDDSGVVVRRDRVATKERSIRTWFGRYLGSTVALEVGRHSPWISRLLTEMGFEPIVGNPRKIALIHGGNDKCDPVDAEKLARLARVDPALLSPVVHRRADTQGSLAIVRSRDVLVRARSRLINSARGQVKAAGGGLGMGSAENFHLREEELPELLESGLSPLMGACGELTQHIRHYDRVIQELCEDVYPETQALLEVNGVGPVTALTFVLTIEEPARFARSRDVGSYLGLRPKRDQSGDIDKQLSITKAGDPLLRRLLVQCAQQILGPFGKPCDLRRLGDRLIARGGQAAHGKAVVAVARRLAVMLHHIWVSGEPYNPDYVLQRSQPAA